MLTESSDHKTPLTIEHTWFARTETMALLEGEIALIAVLREPEGAVLGRRTLVCLEAPCLLPSSPPLLGGVELRWKVVRAGRWESVGGGTQAWGSLPPVLLPVLAERLAKVLAAHGMAPPPGAHLATPNFIEFTPLRGTPARPFGSRWQIIICNNARREEVCDESPYFFLCAFLVDMASACIIR